MNLSEAQMKLSTMEARIQATYGDIIDLQEFIGYISGTIETFTKKEPPAEFLKAASALEDMHMAVNLYVMTLNTAIAAFGALE